MKFLLEHQVLNCELIKQLKFDLASYLSCHVKNKTYGADPKDGLVEISCLKNGLSLKHWIKFL